jgi:16S rRNA (adenine1518-N6/adenine1519-N6)-dimethyltransferase
MDNQPLPKKSLGQHWLDDPLSLEAMCDAANITAEDTILEIGPGQGTLTKVLAGRAKHVVAVEFDQKLAAQLPGRLTGINNVEVVSEDILRFDFTSLPTAYKVVANIPYYLTSNLVRILSETPNPPEYAVLLVQKEVAERVAAKPGAMSLLSVTAQFYWEVSLGRIVPAELFTPPPKVDSQILILQRRSGLLFPGIDLKVFFRVVKAGFSQRRKTLLNSLGAGLHIDRKTASEVLVSAGVEPGRRPQTLSLDEWQKVYENLTKGGII